MSNHHNVNRPTRTNGAAIAERVHIDVPLDHYLDRHIDGAPSTADEQVRTELVAEETLVEEVSIDGMCGVY